LGIFAAQPANLLDSCVLARVERPASWHGDSFRDYKPRVMWPGYFSGLFPGRGAKSEFAIAGLQRFLLMTPLAAPMISRNTGCLRRPSREVLRKIKLENTAPAGDGSGSALRVRIWSWVELEKNAFSPLGGFPLFWVERQTGKPPSVTRRLGRENGVPQNGHFGMTKPWKKKKTPPPAAAFFFKKKNPREAAP